MKVDRYHKLRLANHVLHPETLMLGYYTRLALKSFGRSPGLTALMACAIAPCALQSTTIIAAASCVHEGCASEEG